jgi:serine O-acetyltransferase
MDVARWIRPQEVAALDEVSWKVTLKLLYQHPPLRATAWLRFAAAAHQASIPRLPGLVQRRLLTRFGIEMAPGTDIGGGLYVAHPVGCVLFAERIGENVTVVSAVTFGMRNEPRWPTIGTGAFIGAGARVLGGITLGDGCLVGANAVVVHDVEPGATVVGIPARPVGRG